MFILDDNIHNNPNLHSESDELEFLMVKFIKISYPKLFFIEL